jgi:hypothetical protein
VNLADKIVMRPVGALVLYASNSRTHTPAQLAIRHRGHFKSRHKADNIREASSSQQSSKP